MSRSRPEITVVVDTREQKPYWFPRAEVKTLATGDYSILGFEDRISIERKTKSDAYSSLGQGRPRFEREIQRLAEFDYGAIVVETSLPGFLTAPAFSRMKPKSAVNSIISWSVKYGIHLFFAGDRRHGNALTLKLLEKYWLYHRGESDG